MKDRLQWLFNCLKNQIFDMVDNLLENGFSRKPSVIVALKSSNIKEIAKELGLIEKFKNCYVCNKRLTIDNLSVIYFKSGNWTFVCDEPSCQVKEDITKR